MKTTRLASLCLLVFGSAAATAQQPGVIAPAATLQAPQPVAEHYAPQGVTLPAVTPEIWLYTQQLQRHDDPAQAVRRKAEARAESRAQRIAAMKWYGMSNARPQASPIPLMGQYSPAWVGNGYDRYDWIGASIPTTTIYLEGYGAWR